MAKRPKFYRDPSGSTVVEFDDGTTIHISKDSLTEQELLIIEVLKRLVRVTLDDLLDEVRNRAAQKLVAMHEDIKAIKQKVGA